MLPDTLLATATAAKSGTTVTATVNGVETLVQVARDLTVAAGDVIMIQRFGAQWFATARFYATAPSAISEPVAPPPPKPTLITGSTVVSPVETRSYRASYGWRTDNTDVYHGEYGGWGNHTGAVFYGSKPRSLAGVTVTKATIRVARPAGTGGSYAAAGTTMRLMTNATKPGGAPTLTSSTAGPSIKAGTSTTFTIPDSWAQAMVDGTAGGLAFFTSSGSPYVIFSGKGRWSAAFTLTISWSKVT